MHLSITQHQNGFLKVALPLGSRLHVWSPWNPQIRSDADIHDHPFSFQSVCLAGEMINIEYEAVQSDSGQYVEHAAECVSSFCKQPLPRATNRRVDLKCKAKKIVRRGESYFMESSAIHATDAVFAITLFRKLKQDEGHSRIFARIGSESPKEHNPPSEDLLRMSLSAALRAAHLTLDDVIAIEERIVMSCQTIANSQFTSAQISQNPSYHTREFVKGAHGTADKIVEEALEVLDSMQQGIRVMALHECSDVISAVRGFVSKEFPGIDFSEVLAMSAVTDRAFNSGKRKAL